MRSPSFTGIFTSLSAYHSSSGAELTFKVLVREVEEQHKDRATIVCVNDASASIDHEFGGYKARISDKCRQTSVQYTLTKPTAWRDTPICTNRNRDGKLGID